METLWDSEHVPSRDVTQSPFLHAYSNPLILWGLQHGDFVICSVVLGICVNSFSVAVIKYYAHCFFLPMPLPRHPWSNLQKSGAGKESGTCRPVVVHAFSSSTLEEEAGRSPAYGSSSRISRATQRNPVLRGRRKEGGGGGGGRRKVHPWLLLPPWRRWIRGFCLFPGVSPGETPSEWKSWESG